MGFHNVSYISLHSSSSWAGSRFFCTGQGGSCYFSTFRFHQIRLKKGYVPKVIWKADRPWTIETALFFPFTEQHLSNVIKGKLLELSVIFLKCFLIFYSKCDVLAWKCQCEYHTHFRKQNLPQSHMVWNQLSTLQSIKSVGNMNFADCLYLYIMFIEVFWDSKVCGICVHFLVLFLWFPLP